MMTMTTMFSQFYWPCWKNQFGAILNVPVKVIFIGRHVVHKYLEYIYFLGVNERIITRLKTLWKNTTITDWRNIANFKRWIRIGIRLGEYSRLMFSNTEGRKSLKNKKSLMLKKVLSQTRAIKTNGKSSNLRVIFRTGNGEMRLVDCSQWPSELAWSCNK